MFVFFFFCFITLYRLAIRALIVRYGLVPRSSPRQADLIFTASTVTMKMAPSLVTKVFQNAWRFPVPGIPNRRDVHSVPILSYSTVQGVTKRSHLEDYLPGCPPKPEAVIDAITKHQKKVYRRNLWRGQAMFYYQSKVSCWTQYSYWKLRKRMTLSSIAIYFGDTFWSIFQRKEWSILPLISESGRMFLCGITNSGSI